MNALGFFTRARDIGTQTCDDVFVDAVILGLDAWAIDGGAVAIDPLGRFRDIIQICAV